MFGDNETVAMTSKYAQSKDRFCTSRFGERLDNKTIEGTFGAESNDGNVEELKIDVLSTVNVYLDNFTLTKLSV